MYATVMRALVGKPRKNNSKNKRRVMKCKVMHWMLLCEQWPVRVSWILQLLAEESKYSRSKGQGLGRLKRMCGKDLSDPVSVEDLFVHVIQKRLYDIKNKQCVEEVKKKYQRMFLLDGGVCVCECGYEFECLHG